MRKEIHSTLSKTETLRDSTKYLSKSDVRFIKSTARVMFILKNSIKGVKKSRNQLYVWMRELAVFLELNN